MLKSGDIKKPKNGIKELQRLEAVQPIENWISGTFSITTPRGGRHLYLRVPHPVSNSHGFPDGIDVRGAHGYVVGPGSIVGGKLYRFVDELAPIMVAPAWVMAKLKRPGEHDERRDDPAFDLDKPDNIERARSFLVMREPAVEGRGGNNWTYETASWIRDMCVSEGACVDLMQGDGGWNSRCLPQWSDDELRTVVRNSYRYSQNRPGAHADHLSLLPDDHGIPDDLPDTAPAVSAQTRATLAQRFMPMSEAEQDAIPDPVWLINSVIQVHTINFFVGPSQSYKTFLVMDLCLSAASGLAWCDSGKGEAHSMRYRAKDRKSVV